MTLQNIEPKQLWKWFYALNEVPRPSKAEERVIAFMENFGRVHQLETYKDQVGNIIIKKAASKGMENKQTVILQAHLDMVHQKNENTAFDFLTQGIDMYIDKAWIHAHGTTLGADNGIGVAAMMTLLSQPDMQHPALECLFTIDEETGMTGAKNVEAEQLSGTILLNLDTEEDDEIDIGCAGGVDTSVYGTYKEIKINTTYHPYAIVVKGLKGGHSGMEIHLERGNANKILNRILYRLDKEWAIQIAEFKGGGLRNAIPREASAIFAIDPHKVIALQNSLKQEITQLKREYEIEEPALTIEYLALDSLPEKGMEARAQKKLLQAVYACFNSVFKMSKQIEGLVETSSNMASVRAANGKFEMLSLQRSSVENSKWDVAQAVASPFQLLDMEVIHSGEYPGWQPEVDAPILQLAKEKYRKLFNDEPKVVACHAGLECGILKKQLPQVQMISIGPTILGAHSPSERVSIASVQKFWEYLQAILINIPDKIT